MSKGDKKITALSEAIANMLLAAGRDPQGDPDLLQTGDRVARLWSDEFLSGYEMSAEEILGSPVLGEEDPEVVMVNGLRFHAMCPHHLVPYRGVVHLAYMPRGKLVGFGRLGKLVECFTKRLTLQERVTAQLANALIEELGAKGAGCVIEAEQMCLALPGEKHDQSHVLTSAFVGEMQDRNDIKTRLLAGKPSAQIEEEK